MTDLREAAQAALVAMRRAVPTGEITLTDWMKANHDLEAALAEPVQGAGVTLKPVLYAPRRLTDEEVEGVIKRQRQAEPVQEPVQEPVFNSAPGYCKHCKQYTIEKPLPAEPVQEPVASIYITPNGAREFDDWRHDLPVGRNLLYPAP